MPQEATEMRTYLMIALILLSKHAFAGEVTFIGFDLTPMEQGAIQKQMQARAPSADLQLKLLPANPPYPELTSVGYVIVQGNKTHIGSNAGFNPFDAAQMALGRALDDVAK